MLQEQVQRLGACSLPGVSIVYDRFMTVMWRAVSRGFVTHANAEFVAGGLWHGFDCGYSSSTLSAWTWTFAWSFSSLIWWHLISQKSSQSGTRRASLSFVCPCAYYSTHPGASHFASHPDKPQRHRSLCDASDSRASRARENRRCLASPLPTPLTLPMRRALCAPSRARCT